MIQTAESRGVYSIGFESLGAQKLAPKGWLTGLGFTWGPFMTTTAKSVIAGNFKPAMVRDGLGRGMLVIAPFGNAVPDAVKTLVISAGDKIGNGYTRSPGRLPTITARSASRTAKHGAATRWAISTGTSRA